MLIILSGNYVKNNGNYLTNGRYCIRIKLQKFSVNKCNKTGDQKTTRKILKRLVLCVTAVAIAMGISVPATATSGICTPSESFDVDEAYTWIYSYFSYPNLNDRADVIMLPLRKFWNVWRTII